MRNRICFAVCATVAGLAGPAGAQNDGHLDGEWMSAQLKGKVTLASFAGTFDFGTLEEKVKLDTGSERCYLALHWRGLDNFSYSAVSVCQDAAGAWYAIDDCRLFEMADGTIVSRSCSLPFIAEGDRVAGPGGREFIAETFMRLDAKLGSDGEVKSIKFSGNKGSKVGVFRADYTQGGGANANGSFGGGLGKLKLEHIDSEDVPPGAHAAFQNWVAED